MGLPAGNYLITLLRRDKCTFRLVLGYPLSSQWKFVFERLRENRVVWTVCPKENLTEFSTVEKGTILQVRLFGAYHSSFLRSVLRGRDGH